MKHFNESHNPNMPSARNIRRACANELYRTAKRMKLWVPKDKMDRAAALYYRKVALNIAWITENRDNRKKQADWWYENVSAEIAELWDVDRDKLCEAFRDAYGA